jgi:ADP-ribosylglycohydrolase
MTASRLTHGHPRCQLACAYFVEVAAAMIRRAPIPEAIAAAREAIKVVVTERHPAEISKFGRLFSPELELLPESDLSGSGYVIHCLESSLRCAAGADSYAEGVLRAVNLGDDTDTTGAVTGGLLGLRFGRSAIPKEWVEQLARREDILALGDRFQRVCERKWEADL